MSDYCSLVGEKPRPTTQEKALGGGSKAVKSTALEKYEELIIKLANNERVSQVHNTSRFTATFFERERNSTGWTLFLGITFFRAGKIVGKEFTSSDRTFVGALKNMLKFEKEIEEEISKK